MRTRTAAKRASSGPFVPWPQRMRCHADGRQAVGERGERLARRRRPVRRAPTEYGTATTYATPRRSRAARKAAIFPIAGIGDDRLQREARRPARVRTCATAMRHFSRKATAARNARPGPSLVVLAPRARGRYNSNDVSQAKPSAINAVETATWQLATLPTAPQYCRCTPTEAVPCFGRPVSSIARIPWRTGISSRSRCQNGRDLPGRVRDEVLQALIRAGIAQPAVHRLHRLPLAVVEQPLQVPTGVGAVRAATETAR